MHSPLPLNKTPWMAPYKFKINDAVSFYEPGNRLEEGFIASLKGDIAEVVTEDGSEFRKFVYSLQHREGVNPKRVYTANQRKKSQFLTGETVKFVKNDGEQLFGTIIRMNPKTARVFADGQHWSVPYAMLEGIEPKTNGEENWIRLDSIAKQADKLIEQHNLADWRFRFDSANRRGGLCSYSEKMISLSEQYCLHAQDDEIIDTILHEIAHALVGPEHGHDKVWQSKAKEIGCSGERTHNSIFTPPNYIMTCQHCGWFTGRHKRRRLICKECQTPVNYEVYTPERWNSLSAHDSA